MTGCEHALTLITAGNQVHIKKYCSLVYNENICLCCMEMLMYLGWAI
jgi:hypothetical protein